ncbi:MAG: aa3-type cytochrome c oxidase subunit IV [Sphingomonadales bacterium]|nr:aa3-type cytochrome c oxidase subunit IV [Sphingomonadales bacterium]
MAEHQDMTQANGTYSGFAALMKWGTIVAVIAAMIVVLIIS